MQQPSEKRDEKRSESGEKPSALGEKPSASSEKPSASSEKPSASSEQQLLGEIPPAREHASGGMWRWMEIIQNREKALDAAAREALLEWIKNPIGEGSVLTENGLDAQPNWRARYFIFGSRPAMRQCREALRAKGYDVRSLWLVGSAIHRDLLCETARLDLCGGSGVPDTLVLWVSSTRVTGPVLLRNIWHSRECVNYVLNPGDRCVMTKKCKCEFDTYFVGITSAANGMMQELPSIVESAETGVAASESPTKSGD
jgi:hypothetical protein